MQDDQETYKHFKTNPTVNNQRCQ